MKRLIWTLGLATALALVGCGDDGGTTTNGEIGDDTGATDDTADDPGPDAEDTGLEDADDTGGDESDVTDDPGPDADPVEDTEDPVEDVEDPPEDVEDPPEDVPVEDDVDDPGPPDPATVPLRGPCSDEERVGNFTVQTDSYFSFVQGEVVDGINPFQVQPYVGEEGGCRLRQVIFPFCDPLCEAGTTCAHDGTCVPFPLAQDAGIITITGLGDTLNLEPKPPGSQYFDTTIPHPALISGTLITLTSTDGYAGELELYGIGSESVEEGNYEWVVDDGEPLTVTWPAPTNDDRTHVHVALNIDQHGISPVTVLCDFEDTGSGEIPAALLEELFAFGVSGYPHGRVERRTVDSMDTPVGCVELIARHLAEPTVTVAGHYPCTVPTDCPEGLTCNLAIQTCE